MRPDATGPRHVIAEISYQRERIACSCGDVVSARPDVADRDSHRPLVAAWENHRREAGLRKGTGTGTNPASRRQLRRGSGVAA